MAKGNDIDLENISMKKWKCEKKRVNKRKTKIIMGGGVAMDMESGEMHIVESNSSFGSSFDDED